MLRFLARSLIFAGALLAAGAIVAQPLLTAGLRSPFKLATTPGGNVLVAEGGTGAADGRVSLVSRFGARFPLLDGLPSGLTPEGGALGPTAVADAHRTLYVLIGEGDVLGPSAPGTQVPNPDGLSSALWSSIVRARFDPVPDGIRSGFVLTADDRAALADGREVVLVNDAGESVELLLLADFRDLAPDPVLGVRQSNPFALEITGSLLPEDVAELAPGVGSVEAANFVARLSPESALGHRLLERSVLYAVDAGSNTVIAVAADSGRHRVVARIPPLANPLFPVLGPPVMEPVPTSVLADADGSLLVTVLPGFPFPPGGGQILRVDPVTGALAIEREGLNTPQAVVRVDGDLFVAETSLDLLAGAPGRLVRLPADGGPAEIVAPVLIGPGGLAHDAAEDAIVVSEVFTGRLLRVPRRP